MQTSKKNWKVNLKQNWKVPHQEFQNSLYLKLSSGTKKILVL